MASLTARFGLRKPAGTDLVNSSTDISDNMDKIDAMLPVGMLTAFVGTVAPTGWLLCDGRAVSRVTYADLFTVISTRYGVGDNTTTFNLPDLRNKLPAGQNLPTDAVSNEAIGSHGHSAASVGHDHGYTGSANASHAHVYEWTGGEITTYPALTGLENATHAHIVGEVLHTHGISSHAPVPVQTVNYIVKT